MAYQHTRSENSGQRGRRLVVVGLLVVLTTVVHGQAFAGETGALVRSLLIPGLGQAHQGHYTRASVYAGTAIISGFGILLSQVHYNQSVDRYDIAKSVYAGYVEDLENGEIVNVGDLNASYDEVIAAWNEAEDRLVWRNVFLVTFIATYTVNLVDVLISKPYKLDPDERLAIDVNRERFLVVKTIKF
ncbi:MAG: hypothetical protein JSW50_13425 [Candidatus Latescibacterota bacterium]|nr:MAG: hypothetical protein JSW50_13425 [Candidatus Latescibacterota bacterium]